MNGIEELLKAQTEWFEKVNHEVAGKRGAFVKELADQLQRDGVTAARERIDRLEAHREAVLKRVESAIEAEKGVIERLKTKVADLPSMTKATATRASTASAATKSEKVAAAKPASPRKAASTASKPSAARGARTRRKGSKPS